MDIKYIINKIGQTKLAKATGLNQTTVYQWTVKNRLPRNEISGFTEHYKHIIRLAKEIGIDVTKKDLMTAKSLTYEKTVRGVIGIIGQNNLARKIGVSQTWVSRWCKTNRLPTSDYTSDTEYYKVIIKMAAERGEKVTKKMLLPNTP
jgi:DNA-binding transcriptional regulator YdaS (Cro superfamily)